MILLFLLCSVLSIHQGISKLLFPDVLNNAIADLRYRREASCGGELKLDGGSGMIQLQTEEYNGTEFYRQNEDCSWLVETLPGHILVISAEYFSVEESDDCVWDFVEIRELDISNSVSKYCGWNPFTYITNSPKITIHFKSDISYEDKGFKFIIDSKKVGVDQPKCNSSIVSGERSTIYNEETMGSDCYYKIQAPGSQVVELDLKALQFGSHSCEEERILIYSGLTNQGEPIGKICSDTPNGVQSFHASPMFIVYHNTLGEEGERFLIEYSFVENTFTSPPTPSTTPSPIGGNNDCSGFFKDIDEEMVYTAPEYENNKECIVVVRNTLLPNHVVQITFDYFDIEDSDNCMFDSLRVLSGERNVSAPLGGPYCGESLDGRTFITNGNSLRLEFRTDVSFALRGFQARISFIPNKECSCENNLKCVLQGYEKRCIRARKCAENKCKNGGTCLVSGSQETCYCVSGFMGPDCSLSDGTVARPLVFKKAPTDRRMKRGDSRIEECAVDVPVGEDVEYQWTLNGVVIAPFSSATGFGTYPGGLLEITSFSDELDGQYSCFATSPSGVAEHTFEYRLVDDCDVRIERGPQSEQKKVGENALLQCKVDSRSKQVRWKKNGVYIDFANNPRFRIVGGYNYLRIEDVQMEDAGVYQCEAEDKNGCFSYKEGKLTVINVQSFNKYCGISVHDEAASARISKGIEARPKENPWHVILKSTVEGNEKTFCGGSVISLQFVLTAAHCVDEFANHFRKPFSESSVELLFGTTGCLGNDPATIRRRPKAFYIHPNYAKTAIFDSDIALIELDSAIEYTDAVRPICLEPAEYNDRVFLELSDSLIPEPGRVAGCGITRYRGTLAEYLQVVHLPYVRRDECKESLEGTTNKLTDNMFCAGFSVARKGDTCQGDSGGGLMMTSNARWVQTGIVSWSVGGCDANKYYGVYTNVGNFYTWISGITKFTEEEVPDFMNLN